MSVQHDFARALFDPDQPCPTGIVAWNGSELVNFSVTPAEEGASGFVTAVAAR